MFADYLRSHVAAVERLSPMRELIESVGIALQRRVRSGNKILLCGNGGSAADAQHIAAEFIGRYVKERRALPAVALSTDTSAITAIGNDYGFDFIFSRQVEALAAPGDVLVGISTSGNSINVINAVKAAKERSCLTIGMLGRQGGQLNDLCDQAVIVPSDVTAHIQECHIMIGHYWCSVADELFS